MIDPEQLDSEPFASKQLVDLILVPQGAEYQVVCRGLRQSQTAIPVMPIPIGQTAVAKTLQKWLLVDRAETLPQRVLVMGVCGSLHSNYRVGDGVLYESCQGLETVLETALETAPGRPSERQFTDPALTQQLHSVLSDRVSLVRSLTSDRVIHVASEKQRLGQHYGAAVVDMEGYAILQMLQKAGIAVAMLRTVSDDCHHDMPDLSTAISASGTLQPIPLALRLMRQPIASLRFIQGTLTALESLRQLTIALVS